MALEYESEYTITGTTRIHAALVGSRDAPTVICVHGLGCSHRYFLPLAHALGSEAQVVMPDLPGFGKTKGPRSALDMRGLSRSLAACIRATKREHSVFVANSMGCQVVVDLAAHAPELLGPSVLVGPTVDRHARAWLRQALRLARDVPHERLSLLGVLARDYFVCGPRRFFVTFHHSLRDRIEDKAEVVQQPTIVVRGERDPIVSRQWATEIADALPQGRLVEVPRGGHALNYSRPEAIAPLVRSLLTEAAGRRA